MEIKCKNCGQLFSIPDPESINDIKCPHCGAIYDGNEISSMKLTQAVSEPPPSKPFPTIGQSFILILALYAIIIVLSIPFAVFMIAAGAEKSSAPTVAFESLSTFIAFGVILFFGYRKTKEPFLDVFPLKAFNPILLLPLFLAVAGSTIILSDVDNLVRTVFPAPEWILDIFRNIFANPAAAIVVVVIVPPLTEEFLCRGLVLHGFLKNYSVNKAVIGSALVFMVMHINPWQFAGAFFYGLLFAWLVIKTKSLWPAMIGHAIANFMPILVINIFGLDIPGFSETSALEPGLQPMWFDLLGLAIGLGGFVWLVNVLRDSQAKAEPAEASESFE